MLDFIYLIKRVSDSNHLHLDLGFFLVMNEWISWLNKKN